MNDHKSWLIFDRKTYLIEYIEKTPGGILISINGSEAIYLTYATKNGESADVLCGKLKFRMDLNEQNGVSLWINNTERPPAPIDLVERFRPKSIETNINLGLVIFLVAISLLNAVIINNFENSEILKSGIITSLYILAVYIILHFFAYKYEYGIWLSFGLIISDILVLLFSMFIGIDMTDYREQLFHFPSRLFFLVNLIVYCRLACKLFNLAKSRYLLRSLDK